jgi:hypothetical protein
MLKKPKLIFIDYKILIEKGSNRRKWKTLKDKIDMIYCYLCYIINENNLNFLLFVKLLHDTKYKI